MKKIILSTILLSLLFLTNPTSSLSDDYGMGVWRFASEHEYGDLEPSEFCYVVIKNNNLLMHWNTAVETETISIYRIDKGDDNNFCASKVVEFNTEDDNWSSFSVSNDKDVFNNNKEICGRVKNKKLFIDGWITLDWKEAYISYAFPKAILDRYYK